MSTDGDVYSVLGQVGLPAPVAELAGREWDAIVVGGGHNGLTAAAYLARAGKRVLVCERRDRLGGAATLERPFADQRFVVSPCAYLVGLLDDVVISELELERHGYAVTPADPNLWCPFDDGSSYAGFIDAQRTAEYLLAQGFTDADIAGLSEFGGVFDRIRDLLRRGADGDTWRSPVPRPRADRALLGDDEELIGIVFEESIASTARPLRRRPAAARCDRLPGDDRDLRRARGPGHGGDPPHAPSGRPARPRLVLGLRRGRARAARRSRSPTRRSRPAPRSPPASPSPRSSRARGSSSSPASGSRRRS